MKIDKFENAIVWQKTKDLTVKVYKIFRDCKDYSFRDQIQRAVISISNNIAEGFERSGDKEFIYFLSIAKGSSGELRSMIKIACELKYIDKEKMEEIVVMSEEVSKLIFGLIRSIK